MADEETIRRVVREEMENMDSSRRNSSNLYAHTQHMIREAASSAITEVSTSSGQESNQSSVNSLFFPRRGRGGGRGATTTAQTRTPPAAASTPPVPRHSRSSTTGHPYRLKPYKR